MVVLCWVRSWIWRIASGILADSMYILEIRQQADGGEENEKADIVSFACFNLSWSHMC